MLKRFLILKFLGSGAFGEVFEGRLSGGIPNSNPNSQEHGDSQIVAVKTLKKRESNLEFLKEAKTASALKHDNIVDLIGVCIESNFIILELMEGGDLLSYLKDMRRYVTFPKKIIYWG